MNWTNVALIIAVIAMFAVGIYFLLWMRKSQNRAAAEYREQMRVAAEVEARESKSGDTHEAGAADGGGLSDADRLRFEEQHRSSGSV